MTPLRQTPNNSCGGSATARNVDGNPPTTRYGANVRLLASGVIGVAVVVGVSVIGAVLTGISGAWVVWMVIQVPLGFAIGVLAWLISSLVGTWTRRRGVDRFAKLAALAGAAAQLLLWGLYWLGSAWHVLPLLHIVVLAASTLATFWILREPSAVHRRS